MSKKHFPALLKLTCSRWSEYNAPRLGAALAFYALLSMAPLIILIVAMCGVVFSKADAVNEVLKGAGQFIGPGVSSVIRSVVNGSHRGSGILATIVAVLTLFFGASGVFCELRSSLNLIWGARDRKAFSLSATIKERLLGFLMVLAAGFFLVASLLVSTILTLVEQMATNLVPVPAAIGGEILNLSVSLVSLSLLFAVLYKFVPNVRIEWRDVIVGAIVTSALIALGKLLLTLYLGMAAVGSAYGAAGSVVAFVVWAYYSAQIFFFGAVFTRVYADANQRARDDAPAALLKRAQTA